MEKITMQTLIDLVNYHVNLNGKYPNIIVVNPKTLTALAFEFNNITTGLFITDNKTGVMRFKGIRIIRSSDIDENKIIIS